MFKLCILFCLAGKTKIDDRRAQTREYQEVLKPLKPLFKTEDTLMGSTYEVEPRATEQ